MCHATLDIKVLSLRTKPIYSRTYIGLLPLLFSNGVHRNVSSWTPRIKNDSEIECFGTMSTKYVQGVLEVQKRRYIIVKSANVKVGMLCSDR